MTDTTRPYILEIPELADDMNETNTSLDFVRNELKSGHDSKITIVFSEPMDINFVPNDAIQVYLFQEDYTHKLSDINTIWSADQTKMTLFFHTKIGVGTYFNIDLNTSQLVDLSGNALTSNDTHLVDPSEQSGLVTLKLVTEQTGDPNYYGRYWASTTPENLEETVATDATITATLHQRNTKAVDTSGSPAVTLGDAYGNFIDGEISYSHETNITNDYYYVIDTVNTYTTITFIPNRPMEPNTKYFVDFSFNFTNYTGYSGVPRHRWSFTTAPDILDE